jgi:hypothetical protein
VDSERVLFIVVGVVIVFAVGQLLIRGGRRYLAGSAPTERAAAGPAASLVAVGFHLLTLGVVVLLSVVSLGSDAQTRFLLQLGVFLVVLAAVYGLALVLINRRREDALVAVEVERHDPHGDLAGAPDAGIPGTRPEPLDPGVAVRPVRTTDTGR